MLKYYVTRWKRKYVGCDFCKIKQSLRTFHFETYEQALKFFESADVAVYRVNLKSFDDSTGKISLIGSR